MEKSSNLKELVLLFLAMGAVVLNLVDALCTLTWVQMGIAEEVNPLMRAALNAGPTVFMAAKLALVSAGVAVLWRFRDRAAAAAGLGVVFMVYMIIVVKWHLPVITLTKDLCG